MNTNFSLFCVIGMAMILCVACSNGNGATDSQNPTSPTIAPDIQYNSQPTTGRALLGFWTIRINEDLSYEIVPNRLAEMHLNCTHLLETLCSDCLVLTEIQILPDDQVSALMILKHPFPGLWNYCAFDVRGIFVSGAGYDFPASGKSIAWGDEIPRMLTYDGYTDLFNPTDFPQTLPLALGYIPGHRATDGDLSATLNPYITFRQEYLRSIFEPGAMAYNYVQVYVKNHPLEFGYAVDACWQLVTEPVTDPLEDFPSDANALEAYRVSVEIGEGIVAGGGSAPVSAYILDHQGRTTIASVTAEAPELFNGTTTLSYASSSDGWHCYSGTISNSKSADYGDYPVLVRVTDTHSDQNLGHIDAWQVQPVHIKRGWVRTWGGSADDSSYCTAVDSTGNIIAAGNFTAKVDFDPGPGITQYESKKNMMGVYNPDVFLTSFNSTGAFQWARAFGGPDGDSCMSIITDSSGHIYISGYFMGTADFDPGPGDDFHSSNGMGDAFLSIYDISGNYLRTVTWGGIGGDIGYGIAADNIGGIYVTGFFQYSCDFDPDTGEDIHTSTGSTDIFLVKFDTSGAFQWAHTWGGTGMDSGQSVAVDNGGKVYVTGYFKNTADFDPGAPVMNLTSSGSDDAFLSVIDTNGSFITAYRWGASQADVGDEVGTFGSNNAVYVVGTFRSSADLNPTPGMDLHVTHGSADAYVIKLDSSGVFQWAKSWGGVSTDYPLCVAVDSSFDVYISGRFDETADFDPGPGIDEHTPVGFNDAFLVRFDSSGGFNWARTWGGIAEDYGSGVSVDNLGNAYVSGYFAETVDFDAGSDFDLRTSNGFTDAYLCKYPPDGNW